MVAPVVSVRALECGMGQLQLVNVRIHTYNKRLLLCYSAWYACVRVAWSLMQYIYVL